MHGCSDIKHSECPGHQEKLINIWDFECICIPVHLFMHMEFLALLLRANFMFSFVSFYLVLLLKTSCGWKNVFHQISHTTGSSSNQLYS